MRIGSMFARGSCGALKWATLLGVVFALGAGSVSAQVQSGTAKWTKSEGDTLDVSFKVKARTPASFSGGTIVFNVFLSGDGVSGSTDPRSGDPTLMETTSDVVAAQATYAVPSGAASTDLAEATFNASIFINADADAEDEIGTVRVGVASASGGLLKQGTGGTAFANSDAAVMIGTLTIDDPHEQTFEWHSGPTTASPAEEGSGETVTVQLRGKPVPAQYLWAGTPRTDSATYGIGSASRAGFVLGAGATNNQVVALNAAGTDGNREDDDVEVTIYHSGTSVPFPGVKPYKITFEDIHALPKAEDITWKAYASKADGTIDTNTEVESVTEGGDAVHVRVTVARGEDGYPSGEDLNLAVMPAAGMASDVRIEGAPLTFNRTGLSGSNNSKTGDFKVYALEDSDVGAEDLMLDLVLTGKTTVNGPGEVMAKNPVMLAIEDETTPLLTAMTGEMVEETVDAARMESAGMDGNNLWTPGEMFSLDSEDLFTSDSTVQVAAMSSGGAVGASTQGSMVMLTAMEVGMATITITGTVASSSFTATQTVDNIATIEFDLEVDELPLTITLDDPEDMNVAEGMSAMVTATANRAVTADTMVTLNLVEGSGSPADYEVEPIMIKTGEMMGTTMLMATEDGMVEPMETLTFEGSFGSGMTTTNRVTFNIWDAAVPALPIIAQLLLAAFLAVGGYRRYLRRR